MALRTFSEMKSRVFGWTGLNSEDSDHVTVVEQAINSAYKDVLSRLNLRIQNKEGTLYLVAPYITGTVQASGTTITGTGTHFTNDMEGRYIALSALGKENLQIVTVDSPTSLTLVDPVSSPITEDSPFMIFQSDYTMAEGVDENTVKYIIDTFESRQILPLPNDLAEKYWPNQGNLDQGVPYYYSFVGRSSELAPVLRFYPIPNVVRAIRYVAQDRASDLTEATDLPVLPERYQDVLDEGAKSIVFNWLGKQDRADKHEKKYEQYIQLLRVANKGVQDFSYKMSTQDSDTEQLRGLRLPANFPDRRY